MCACDGKCEGSHTQPTHVSTLCRYRSREVQFSQRLSEMRASAGRCAARAVRCLSTAANVELGRFASALQHGLPKFTGLPTFFRAPLAAAFSDVDIGLVGVPYDLGANNPGTRLGPRAVRSSSAAVRKQNQATGVRPFDLCRCAQPLSLSSRSSMAGDVRRSPLSSRVPRHSVADVGDAWVERTYGLQREGVAPPVGSPPPEPRDTLRSSHDEIQTFFNALCDAGASPVSVGGDHSVSLPILRALRRAAGRPLALVHLDAHMDTAPPEEVFNAVGAPLFVGAKCRRWCRTSAPVSKSLSSTHAHTCVHQVRGTPTTRRLAARRRKG